MAASWAPVESFLARKNCNAILILGSELLDGDDTKLQFLLLFLLKFSLQTILMKLSAAKLCSRNQQPNASVF